MNGISKIAAFGSAWVANYGLADYSEAIKTITGLVIAITSLVFAVKDLKNKRNGKNSRKGPTG